MSLPVERHGCAFFAVASLALTLCACGGASTAPDAGSDAGYVCPANVPTPSDPCIPRCGNSLGIGQPCTKGGGQCPKPNRDLSNGWLCTVDQDPSTNLAFCTTGCARDANCGENMVCTGDPGNPNSNKGCVPAACYTAPADAGSADGGRRDGGDGG